MGSLNHISAMLSGESPHCYTLGFPWVELFHCIEKEKIKIKGNLSFIIAQDFVKSFPNSNTA